MDYRPAALSGVPDGAWTEIKARLCYVATAAAAAAATAAAARKFYSRNMFFGTIIAREFQKIRSVFYIQNLYPTPIEFSIYRPAVASGTKQVSLWCSLLEYVPSFW